MLAMNQNRNSSWELESRVHTLQEHFHHMSQDLEQIKQSTTQEIEGLREWSRKLEKKSKRIEGRMSLMERNLRESHRHVQEEKPDLGQDFSNLSQELQNQEERLAALQAQRDELLVGLNGLQDSLKKQVLRVNRVEGQLGEVLHLNGGGNIRSSAREGGALQPNVTSQEYYEPHRRGKTHRGGRPGKILGGYHQPSTEEISATSQPEAKPYQHHASNQPQHLKAQKPGPQPYSLPQTQEQYTNPKPQSVDYLPLPDPHHPQSQIQLQAQTRPYPVKQEQLPFHHSVPYHHVQTQIKQPLQPQRHPHLHNPNHSSKPQPMSRVQTQPGKNGQSRTRLEPQSEPYQPRSSRWKDEKEEESSVIHDILQLPLRHKIPQRPIPKKDASICNVDSMLVFPSASAENYVTFSSTLPVLPELSLCLWLRVENSHIGTLFSYATNENDNQLVLYGRNSSSSSTYSSPFSPSFHYSSSPSLDFVIGDPAYRRLSISSFLDARWHHLCIVWSSIQGRFWHYSDRRLTSSGSKFRKGWEIPGGGSVVLGQEQDTVGGGFDPAEGYAGQIAGFRVWNRVLSPFEVEGVAEGRGVPRGVVLDMEDIKEVHGEVQQVACECLEHCV
ncbi:hypothetical protein JOB18_006416 [Solea senegalensis]|nr:hypothetical protein JOB18_006416 [Solea senegalensis]